MREQRLEGPGSEERLRAVRARFKRFSGSIDRRQVLSSLKRWCIIVTTMLILGLAAELIFTL